MTAQNLQQQRLIFTKRYFHLSSGRDRSKSQSAYEWEPQVQALPVYDYSRERAKTGVYAWGLCSTGAFGKLELVEPKNPNTTPSLAKQNPIRMFYDFDVKTLAVGDGFTLIVPEGMLKRAKLYGCGLNMHGQIGFHTPKSWSKDAGKGKSRQWIAEPSPIQVPVKSENSQVTRVACGLTHSLVATSDLTVFSLGHNSSGQCGRKIIPDENYTDNNLIYRIRDLSGLRVKQLVCGYSHSVVLLEDGRVFSFGDGANGQLGTGSFENRYQPELVGGDISGEKIVKISCVANTALAINETGDVFGWGSNEARQLSFENVSEVPIPRHLQIDSIVGKVVSMAAGETACAVVNEAGLVYTWGQGPVGRGPNCSFSPVPTLLPAPLFASNAFNDFLKVVRIEAGPQYFAAVNEAGGLFTWGNNDFCALGVGLKPMKGYPFQSFPWKVSLVGDVLKIFCGRKHAMAIARPWV